MLRKIFMFSALIAMASTAQAGILSSVLTVNGVEDQLSTTSPAGLASVIKADGSAWNPSTSTLASGDIVYGFVASNSGFNDILGSPSSMDFAGNNAVGMFAGELQASGSGFNLVMPTDSSFRLSSLVDDSFASSFAGFEDQAMFAMISGANGVAVTTPAIEADDSTGEGLKYFTADDYGLDFLASTSDLGDGQGFFQFLGTPGVEPQIGQQRAGLNVLPGSGALGDLEFVDVAIDSLFSPPTVTDADVALDSTLVNLTTNPADQSFANRGWEFRTTSSAIRLNVVPEPTSLVSFAGLALLGLGGLRRRKGAKKTAA